jgi:hypothetical protein
MTSTVSSVRYELNLYIVIWIWTNTSLQRLKIGWDCFVASTLYEVQQVLFNVRILWT